MYIIILIILLYLIFYQRYPWKETIVLNLKRREKKFNITKAQLSKWNIYNIKRWEAIDGQKLDDQPILMQKGILHPNFKKYKWDAQKKGAIGNYLSFINIHSYILESNNDYTLILEDDIILDHSFYTNFNLLWNSIKNDDWDLIYLGISNVTISKTKKDWKFYKKINDTFKIYVPFANNGELYGNFGLLVKPKVSKIWLENCLPITQASDSRMGSLVCGRKLSVDKPNEIQNITKQLNALVVYPPLISYTFSVSDTSR